MQFTPGTLLDRLTASETATVTVGYTVQDAALASASSTLTLTVQGAEDAPVVVSETVAVNEDQLFSATTRATGLLGNDSDVDTGETATLVITGAHVGSGADLSVTASPPLGGTIIPGTYGALLLRPDGTYAYQAATAAAEALAQGDTVTETFSYTVRDAQNGGSTGTVAFIITGQNDAPVAAADTDSAGENETKTFDVQFNDSDVDARDVKTLTSLGAVTVTAATAR